MKVLIILLITIIGSIIADDPCEYDNQDGQPGCTTDLEMCKKLWRNNWDPTKYWECTERGAPGVLRSCPPSEAFFAPTLECVDKNIWKWTPMCDPPSKPATNATNKIGSAYNGEQSPCESQPGGDGQPGCKTALEMCQRYWPDHSFYYYYWECVKQGEPAVSRVCEQFAQGIHGRFYIPLSKCVPYEDWRPSFVCDPPSKP